MLLHLRAVAALLILSAAALPVPSSAQISVWGWRGNNQGRLGIPDLSAGQYPLALASLADMVQIAASGNHSHGRKADGTAWSWGDNTYGVLGNGSASPYSAVPVQVSGLTNVVDISAGSNHVLAVKSDGTVWSWGYNYFGQLGNGTKANSSVPVQVSGLTNVVKVSGGYRFSLALKSDGTVWAWGQNNLGQFGNGTKVDSATPVPVSVLTGVTAISAGATHALALKNDGTLWGWGDNYAGQVGTGATPLQLVPYHISSITDVKQFVAGWFFSIVVKNDGTVWYTGFPASRQKGLRNIVGVATSGGYGVEAVDSSGVVWEWSLSAGPAVPVPVVGLAKMASLPALGFGYRDESKPWSRTVILQNQSSWRVALMTLTGNQFTSSVPTNPAFGPNLVVAASADFDRDGYDDLVVQNTSTRELYIYYMQGSQIVSTGILNNTPPPDTWAVATVDLGQNGDGKPELVFQNTATQRVYISRIDLPNSIVDYKPIDKALPAGWRVIGTADMNRDGVKDLIVHNASTRQISVLTLGGFEGRVVQASISLLPTMPAGWVAGGVGDFDGDGQVDIVVQNTGTRQVAVLTVADMKIKSSYSVGPIPLAGWMLVGPK